jgi:Siphovirus-type tail component, C-terminal domain
VIDNFYIDGYLLHPGTNSKLLDVKGLGTPSPRSAVFTRANAHGAFDRTRFHEGRLLTLTGISWGSPDVTVWEAFDEIKQRLALGSTRVGFNLLKFRLAGRAEDEQVLAKVSTAMDDELVAPDYIKWAVTMFASDPRIYTDVPRHSVYFPAAAPSAGGLAMPLDFPLDFLPPAAGTIEVVSEGTWTTPPFMGLLGPVVNPIIENLTTGQSLRFVVNMGGADTLAILSVAHTIFLNGVSRLDLLDASSSTWWELQPGLNVIRVSGSGMTAATAFGVVFFDARI